jgi:hypothetical protein
MSHQDEARANWRADLLEYTAAALRQAGLDRLAEEKEELCGVNRGYAVLMADLAEAKRTGVNLMAVKVQVADFRASIRSGGLPRPGVVNNFIEPSVSELEGLGY